MKAKPEITINPIGSILHGKLRWYADVWTKGGLVGVTKPYDSYADAVKAGQALANTAA
jgi:hypothetical protein